MEQVIRIMIVDDHLVVREGIKFMLETTSGFVCVGEAENGREALRVVAEVEPDIILMDLRMPEMDGLEAIQQIRREFPQIAIVILTTYNEDALMIRGLQAGARGYLLKDTSRAQLFETIRAAVKGKTLVEPEIMTRLLSFVETSSHPGQSKQGQSKQAGLTEREREVLEGLARGERRKEIAARLCVSERTVKAYITNIYTKLNVDSSAAAVAIALKMGLLPTLSVPEDYS